MENFKIYIHFGLCYLEAKMHGVYKQKKMSVSFTLELSLSVHQCKLLEFTKNLLIC